MSVLGDVFGSLESMSQVQLLLAFVACTGYAFAQGSLLSQKGRRIAWAAAAVAAVGFAFESADWMRAAMLLVFAVAGMGSFIALVWLLSRALGFGHNPSPTGVDAAELDFDLDPDPDPLPATAASRSASPRGPTTGGPAHSV